MINRRYFKACALLLASVMAFTGCGSSNTSSTAPTTGAPSTQATGAPVEEVNEADIQIEGYNLLWHDEFSGTELDESIWTREVREVGWTNNELQAYTTEAENIFLEDGHLTLKALKKETENGGVTYTSGKVNSQNKTDFTYGKVVARAKAPKGKGLWPAIWMMPQDEQHYGQWPKCGEIDIMEVLGDDVNRAYCTVHYGEPHAEQQGIYNIENVLKDGTFASEFHEYSVEWEPGEMRWYIDKHLVLTVNDWFTAVDGEDEKPYPAPFDQPFFVQMNLAVGGNWPGDPDEKTDFNNAEFQIDYVRVYQKPEYDTNVTKPEKPYKKADESGNFVTNGDFAADINPNDDFTFYLAADGAGSAEVVDGELVISSTNEGTEEYSVQVFQALMPQLKGHKYKFSFDIRADEPRTAIAAVTAPTGGWIRYFPDTTFDVTKEKQHMEFEYEMTEKDDNNGRIEFNLGKQGSTATVYISNVRFEEVTE